MLSQEVREPKSKRKKVIWIFNHYASTMYVQEGGRHYSLGKELVRYGYEVKVFCASTLHNSFEAIAMGGSRFKEESKEGIDFVFVKTRPYQGNGRQRILNMLDFYRGVLSCADSFDRPDVIIGSSVHPLAHRAALRLSKRYECKCILEIRDLWPETLVSYGILKRKGILSRLFYSNERKSYEKADSLVFTMEGALQYIKDKGWDIENGGCIDPSKVFYVNNGVDLDAFWRNLKNHPCSLDALSADDGRYKVVYAGSVRRANDIGFLVEVASLMRSDPIDIVVIGDGDDLGKVRDEAERRSLANIFFIGPIPKNEIPSALSCADVTLMLYSANQVNLSRYGMSQNKLFDYLASGKPILSNLPSNYSIINEFECGVERAFSNSSDFAQTLREMVSNQELMKYWGENARKAAALYSYERHAEHYVHIIESLAKEEKN